jgi:hypothetical protein
MEETANADPSFLFSRGREAAGKGIRDDGAWNYFSGVARRKP